MGNMKLRATLILYTVICCLQVISGARRILAVFHCYVDVDCNLQPTTETDFYFIFTFILTCKLLRMSSRLVQREKNKLQ